MGINVQESSIIAATAGTLFENDGGTLIIQNLLVSDVDAAAVVATANAGTSIFQESRVTASGVDDVMAASTGSSQSVVDVTVSNMRRISRAFSASGSNTKMLLSQVRVLDNSFTTKWTIASASLSAEATISDSLFLNNDGLEFAVSAVGSETKMSILGTSILSNVGVTVRSHLIGYFSFVLEKY